MRVRFLIFILALGCQMAWAQSRINPYRWNVDASLGLSRPLGEFGLSGNASFWGERGGVPLFYGFRKAHNGSAETGTRFNLDLSYRLSNNVSIGMHGSFHHHGLDMGEMEQVFNTIGGSELVNVDHDPYKAQMIIPYLALRLTEVEPQFSVRIGYGYGRLAFPSYEFIDSAGVRYGYSGSTDPLFSGALLAGTKASVPVSIFRAFASVDYTTARFDYLSVNNSSTDPSERSFYDHVMHRTLSITCGLTYSF